MANERSKTINGLPYVEASVAWGSINAGAVGTATVDLPIAFVRSPQRPIIAGLKLGQTAFVTGLIPKEVVTSIVSGRVRVTLQIENETAGALTPATKTWWFVQL